jgi:hypothetical protein
MTRLGERERRLVAIFILLLLLAAAWLLLVAPLVEGFRARAELRTRLGLDHARNSRLINAIPAMRRRAEQARALGSRLAILAPDPAAGQDRLRERLRTAFGAAGGEVRAAQSVSVSAGRARAWVEGQLTLAQIERLLVALQADPPFLTVEAVRISGDTALETGRLDKLDVRVEASIPYLSPAS